MELHEGCDLSLTRLVSDKFNINSAGKSPQSRRVESYEKKFSSRMVPHTISFDESQTLLDQNPNVFSKSYMDDVEHYVEKKEKSPILEDQYVSFNSKNHSFESNLPNIFNSQSKSLKNIFNQNDGNSGVAKKNLDSSKCNFSPLKSIENTLRSPYADKNMFSWRDENDINMKSPKLEFGNNLRMMENKENISKISDTNINHLKMGNHSSIRQNYMHASEDNIDGACIFGSKDQFPYQRKEDLLNVQYFSSNSGKTPSKFSVVKDRLSPYNIPRRYSKNISESSLQDYTSRDSGFENSSSFDAKLANTSNIDSQCQTLMDRFDDYEMDESVPHFEAEKSSQCLPDSHTSDYDFHTLHDLEEEFDTADNAIGSSCSKYEIISTDSPDICSSSNRVHNTIIAQDFQFGSPIGDLETSENFNVVPKISRRMPIRSETTRMLKFDTETTSPSFKFLSPKTLPPKKLEMSPSPCATDSNKTQSYNFFSLGSKLSKNWGKNIFESKLEDNSKKTNCDIDNSKNMKMYSGDSVSPFISPLRSLEDNLINKRESKNEFSSSRVRPSRLFNNVSTSSLESGCISEMEETMFDLDEQCQSLDFDVSSTISSSIQSLIRGEIQSKVEKTPNRLGEKLAQNDGMNNTPLFRRCLSLQADGNSVEKVRTALFQSPGRPRKRSEITDDAMIVPKRRKSQMSHIAETFRPILQRTISDNEATIKVALSKAYNEPDLIGDFSRPYSLPLEESQHRDLKAISSSTLALLIEGEFKNINSFKVIDCRYPYEYNGGHIIGAQNLFTEDLVQSQLLTNVNTKSPKSSPNRNILIFHCEFSFKRGPELCRFLRRADRGLSEYPQLTYPELYVLRDGYHGFHIQHKHLCQPTPGAYVPMLDPRFSSDLRMHRSATSRRTLK